MGPVEGKAVEIVRDGRRQVAVLRADGGTIALRLVVADPTRPPDVRVIQVAGPGDEARPLAGYRVSLEVAP
ncbi:hypothetical protein D3C83_288110 [compost metagenome]